MSNQCQICQFKCQFNVRSHICAINSGKGNITCNLRVFDICGSVDAKIIYFKQRKKYQIDLTVIWQLNWPIWQWSDNWIDQFDDADHIAIRDWSSFLRPWNPNFPKILDPFLTLSLILILNFHRPLESSRCVFKVETAANE